MNVLGKKLTSAVLVLALALATALPATSWSGSDERPSSEPIVTLTLAEVDSLTALIDGQAHQIRLLQVDLWECRELARVDSLQVELLSNPDRDNWFTRAIKHPVVWFALGAYLGIRATEAN